MEGVTREGERLHRTVRRQVYDAISAAWESAITELFDTMLAEATPDALIHRFETTLRMLVVRPLMRVEIEGISCEVRRWRIGFLAKDRTVDPATGRIYKVRCYRRTRGPYERPPPEAEWWLGIPARLAEGVWSVQWFLLESLSPQ